MYIYIYINTFQLQSEYQLIHPRRYIFVHKMIRKTIRLFAFMYGIY